MVVGLQEINNMIVTFYLEIEDGSRHTIVNHTLTKISEIDWLLKQVKQKLEEAIVLTTMPNKIGEVIASSGKEELGQKIKRRF